MENMGGFVHYLTKLNHHLASCHNSVIGVPVSGSLKWFMCHFFQHIPAFSQ